MKKKNYVVLLYLCFHWMIVSWIDHIASTSKTSWLPNTGTVCGKFAAGIYITKARAKLKLSHSDFYCLPNTVPSSILWCCTKSRSTLWLHFVLPNFTSLNSLNYSLSCQDTVAQKQKNFRLVMNSTRLVLCIIKRKRISKTIYTLLFWSQISWS